MKAGLTKLIAVIIFCTALFAVWIMPKPAVKPIGQKTFVTTSDGARIAYYQSGPIEGQRVLLLASLGRSVSDFNELVGALNNTGYRTITVDIRGIGHSKFAPGQEPLDLFGLAEDVNLAMTNSEGKGASIVIGHAFGNRLARVYATHYPDSINGIVLIAAGGSQNLQSNKRVFQALLNCFNWKLLPPKRNSEIKYAFFAGTNKVPTSWKRGWYKASAKMQIQAVRATPVELWRAGGGAAPILVLQADSDIIAPAALTSVKLKAVFPKRVKVVTVQNAGHALLPEQPESVARETIAFIGELLND